MESPSQTSYYNDVFVEAQVKLRNTLPFAIEFRSEQKKVPESKG